LPCRFFRARLYAACLLVFFLSIDFNYALSKEVFSARCVGKLVWGLPTAWLISRQPLRQRSESTKITGSFELDAGW